MSQFVTCDRCGNENAREDETGFYCSQCDHLSDKELEDRQLSAECEVDARMEESRMRSIKWALDKVLNA